MVYLALEKIRKGPGGALVVKVPLAWLQSVGADLGDDMYVVIDPKNKAVTYSVAKKRWAKSVKLRMSGSTPVLTMPKDYADQLETGEGEEIELSMDEMDDSLVMCLT